jgi:hypothetical protein
MKIDEKLYLHLLNQGRISSIPEPIFDLAPSGKWLTRDGDVLNISDMNNEHLLNSIRLVARYGKLAIINLAWAAGAYAETTGGEMASYYAELESDKYFEAASDEDDIHEFCLEQYGKYKQLVKEQERRHLARKML